MPRAFRAIKFPRFNSQVARQLSTSNRTPSKKNLSTGFTQRILIGTTMSATAAADVTSPVPTITRDELLGRFDTFLFDADGVLWTGDRPVPGAIEFVTHLLADPTRRVFILTNNSTKTIDQYVEKLEKIGFGAVRRQNVISPSLVLADYFRRHADKFAGQPVYLIGTEDLKKTLETEGGVKCFGTGPDHLNNYTQGYFIHDVDLSTIPRAVVCSFDSHFSYPKIMKAVNFLAQPGVEFLVTNEDYTFPGPNPGVLIPGSGATTASVQAVSGRTPTIFGKPWKPMMDFLKRTEHIDAAKTVMFGDRLDTDIKFANDNGLTSCWMQTGVHTMEDVDKARRGPDPGLVPQFTHSFTQP